MSRVVGVLLAAALVLVLAFLTGLLLAAGDGDDGTGLNADEAMNAVERRVRQSRVQEGGSPAELYSAEASEATAPTGEKAWLVRVHYTGGSTCMYVWYKDAKYHTTRDRGCFHWVPIE